MITTIASSVRLAWHPQEFRRSYAFERLDTVIPVTITTLDPNSMRTWSTRGHHKRMEAKKMTTKISTQASGTENKLKITYAGSNNSLKVESLLLNNYVKNFLERTKLQNLSAYTCNMAYLTQQN